MVLVNVPGSGSVNFSMLRLVCLVSVALLESRLIILFFPHNLAGEYPSSPSQVPLRFPLSAICRTSFLCRPDSFLPVYLKYPSEALEDVNFVVITFIHFPRLAAINQDWFY